MSSPEWKLTSGGSRDQCWSSCSTGSWNVGEGGQRPRALVVSDSISVDICISFPPTPFPSFPCFPLLSLPCCGGCLRNLELWNLGKKCVQPTPLPSNLFIESYQVWGLFTLYSPSSHLLLSCFSPYIYPPSLFSLSFRPNAQITPHLFALVWFLTEEWIRGFMRRRWAYFSGLMIDPFHHVRLCVHA